MNQKESSSASSSPSNCPDFQPISPPLYTYTQEVYMYVERIVMTRDANRALVYTYLLDKNLLCSKRQQHVSRPPFESLLVEPLRPHLPTSVAGVIRPLIVSQAYKTGSI